MELADFKERAQALSESDITQAELEELIGVYFSHKPIPYYHIEPGRFVARGRYNKNGEIFHNKSQLSYNSKISEVLPGRANYAHQPKFYAAISHDTEYSDTVSTVIMEVAHNHIHDLRANREYFTLSRWRVKKELVVVVLPFSKSIANRNPNMVAMREYYNDYLVKQFGNHPANQYFLDSLEYISDLYCQYENKTGCYRICAAFYNALLKICRNMSHDIDGLVYPSANTFAAGINIVLNAKSVDEKLELDWIQMIAMQRNPADECDIFFSHASDEQVPDKNGNFYFKKIV